MRAVAVALALLCIPFVAPPSQADVALVRVIVGNETYENGEFVFPDYLIVPVGSTLTFRNATVWLDAARLCTGRTNLPAYRCQPQLQVNGALVIEDSKLDSHLWHDDVDAGYILHVERGTAHIARTTLTHYQQVTFQQAGRAPSVVEDSVFRHGNGPIRFMQGVEAVFRRNLVEDVREGIMVTDASTPIEDNTVKNVTLTLGASSFHWAITVLGASPNDHVWASRPPIRRNVIDNATVGIVSRGGTDHLIEDNVIRNTVAAMLIGVTQDGSVLDRQPSTIRRNLIHGATEGVRISGAAAAGPAPNTTETVDLRDNVMVDVSCYPVRILPMPNTIRVNVDATGIWWGSGRGPEEPAAGCATVRNDDDLATFDLSSWLRAPPKWATPHLPSIKAS